MAIGGKTAGIVAGLAVGLTSGVFLAAVNPVLPRTDTTTVAPTPKTVGDNLTAGGVDESGPNLSPLETNPVGAENSAVLPDQPATENTPKPLEQPTAARRSTDTQAPTANPTPQETELAVLVPETGSVPSVPQPSEAIGSAAPENRPQVSTEPAAPIELEQPKAQADDPQSLDTAPSEPETVVTTPEPAPAPQEQETVAVIEEPSEQATPPKLSTTPADPLPASEPEPEPKAEAVPETEASQEDVATKAVVSEPEEDKPNTSGTFKTQGSRLPTVGDSNNRLATLGQGGSSSRIPRIGATAEPDSEVAAEPEPSLAKNALQRNANGFESTGKPLLSLVLLDSEDLAQQLPDLKGLGLPFAIAVSLDAANAAQNAQTYREAGFEVLALAPRDVKLSLSGGQTDEQVASALDQIFELAPQAIGLIDRPTANMQKDQRLSRAILRHFAQTGHGLVTYGGGLNAVPRMAAREGVANGMVHKLLNANGESAPVITRYLDRAAREARSKGSVIVMAQATQTTLGTILAWSLSSKSNNVSFAPISATLLASQE